jgi:hypothetical protein
MNNSCQAAWIETLLEEWHMGWRRLTGLAVIGVALVALTVALVGLSVNAQPSAVPEEPVCAADAAATVAAAQTAGETKALEAAYGVGMEAFAPGGSRLCVTAAQMAAEAQAAQALESGQGAPSISAEGASRWPESCLAGEAFEAETADGACAEGDADCGD